MRWDEMERYEKIPAIRIVMMWPVWRVGELWQNVLCDRKWKIGHEWQWLTNEVLVWKGGWSVKNQKWNGDATTACANLSNSILTKEKNYIQL